MKHLPLLFACLVPFVACSKPATPTGTPPAGGNAATGKNMADDHGHGTPHDLGSMTIGAHSFELVQFGKVEAGHEIAVEMTFAKDKALPGTVRAWVGVESGEGSMKAKVGKDADHPNALHGHVEVPAKIPAGSKLWLEIEENGKAERGSIAWQ